MKLLYAEDEPAMAEAVTDILNYHNFMVDSVADGAEALAYARAGDYDGIILDIMLPKMSGLDVLRELREGGCRTPVLLLTAKAEVEDRILGLDLGADDYLPKPFAMGELLARVRAMLRRADAYTPDELSFADLVLDRRSSRLSSAAGAVTLTRLECRMLEALLLNRGACLSTEELLVKVWGYETETEPGAVWVYVSALRRRRGRRGLARAHTGPAGRGLHAGGGRCLKRSDANSS